jgi:Uma2 family endonuclease
MASTMSAIKPLAADSLYEIVDGEQREIAPMGALAGTLATFLAGYLNAFAAPRKLGAAVVEVLFTLKKGRSRRPDVAFVTLDRWQSMPSLKDDPAEMPFPPNLAVEAISPSNSAGEVEEKIIEYFDAGVSLVWIIHPVPRRIYVHRSPTDVQLLGESDELDGGAVLPGFRLKISELFAAIDALASSQTHL